MRALTIPLALATLALVAGCAYRATPAPTPVVIVPQPAPAVVQAPAAPPVVVAPTALRPGTGQVESIAAVPASPRGDAMRRLGIKMSDGTMQYVDSEVRNLAIGDRVELTADGYLRPI
jgi:multidrug efflux pump subunit AcrA (membrane-fusion protein)